MEPTLTHKSKLNTGYSKLTTNYYLCIMNSKRLVLFLDSTHPLLPQKLEEAGFEVKNFSGSVEELKAVLPQVTGLVVRSKFTLTRDVLESASNLCFIARAGAGMENIDVAFAESKGIACLSSPEGNRDAVGEQALGMLLMLMNNLRRADIEVRNSIWKREANRGFELTGKTVGIIGYGNMGSAFAQKISGFGCRVIAFDKYKTGYSSPLVEEKSMQALFDECNVVSLHVPLTEETTYLADEKFFDSFRKPIWFINTSRGMVCKTSALITALEAGLVMGAALDVLEWEDFSFENFFKQSLPAEFTWLTHSDKVVLSPHIAGWTHESNVKHAEVLFAKIIALR